MSISLENIKPTDNLFYSYYLSGPFKELYLRNLNKNNSYEKGLYSNSKYVDALSSLSTTYTSADLKLNDTNDQFTGELIKTVNLGIGILGLFYYMYYIQKH
jgi:hypothetical protein